MSENITKPQWSPREISLLWPDHAKRASLAEYDAERLELYELLDITNSDIDDYFTADAEAIRYRQRVVADICENEGLEKVLSGMLPFLSDIMELRNLSNDAEGAGDAYLYSITEAEIYNSLMEYLKDSLLPLRDKVRSEAMAELCSQIDTLANSEYYKTVNEKLSELANRVRDIKSVTVGVNLDALLQPTSAGVVSVNADPFKSGDFFERVMRLDFKKDEMTCIADLSPVSKNQNENRKMAMANAFNSALTEVYKSSLKEWRRACKSYVLENTDFLLRLAPEIEFLTKAAELVRDLTDRGCTLTYPEVRDMSEKTFNAKGLCNPVIALKSDGELVPNDFSFDENGMIYVVTGPNRGGKSVITCAVGHAFAMAQLGLPVCAESLEISPCDKILTHFPGDSADTIDKGRLGEECARLEAIFDTVSENSLVLLDESLSSTGSFEASYIASEVLRGFAAARCRAVFSTHLHDLAASIDKINEMAESEKASRIDSLVAEVDKGKRSFKIVRKKPDGKSYASDIANKYGLSFDKINEKFAKNQTN